MPLHAPIPVAWSLALASSLTIQASLAADTIYKCHGPANHTIYQETPCHPGATPATIYVHQPTPDEQEAASQRAQEDRAAAKALEQEQAQRRRASRQASERRETEARQKQLACDKLQAEAERLERGERQRSATTRPMAQEDRAAHLRSKHFSECFATQ